MEGWSQICDDNPTFGGLPPFNNLRNFGEIHTLSSPWLCENERIYDPRQDIYVDIVAINILSQKNVHGQK